MSDQARNDCFQSNTELMLHLKDSGYIRSNFVFDIMCSVNRRNFTTNNCTAYRDRPEVVAYEKTISAPHMHAIVLEQISDNLRHGKCALDIGSGSGYLTVCMALALGEKGRVIGIDCIPGFQNMANQITQNHYPELLQNNRVKYIVYDGRRGWPCGGPYDAIHVGVAAESIPETLIEQLAPGGCLIMPIGLAGHQVLVLLKKSLSGNIEKKDLMKVKYGTFIDVDVPCSSMVENGLILDQGIENKNTLVPRPQPNGTPINELFSKESIKNPIETTETDRQTESEILENINSMNETHQKNTNQRKTVLEKMQIFENKDDNYQKSKSQEDIITAMKLPSKTTLIEDPKKYVDTKAENHDEKWKIIKLNEGVDNKKNLYAKPLKENMPVYKSVVELECAIPKIIGGDKNAQAEESSYNIKKSIDDVERNISNSGSSDSEEIELASEDSDEVSSVATEIDTQAFYECEDSDEILSNIQLDPKIYISSKSCSKSLENCRAIQEPMSKSRTSISTIIKSDKNRTQTVRDKIELFEQNIKSRKISNSLENITIKIKSTPRENGNAFLEDTNENMQVLKNSKDNEVLQTGAVNVQTKQETRNDNSGFSKSLENLTCNKTESVQQEIDIVNKGNTEKNHNNIKQEFNVADKNETNRESILSEFKLFKDEIKFILDNFLSSEKENHEEIKLRQMNVHIDRIHQVHLVNNHDQQEESNSPQSVNQNEKPYENLENDVANKKLSADKQDTNYDDLQVQMRIISKEIEQLQAQHSNNIEKLITTNEELQGRINHYENLEKRLQNLEERFKLITKVLAKLIDKINCHEKVFNVQLAITEKEEASRVLEKLNREQSEEKINNVISAISRISQEIKATGCNFVDNITKDKNEHSVKQSKTIPDTYVSNSESFLSEMNLIKALLHSGRKISTVENESPLNNENEYTDNENEMNLLKNILEEK